MSVSDPPKRLILRDVLILQRLDICLGLATQENTDSPDTGDADDPPGVDDPQDPSGTVTYKKLVILQ